MVPDQLLRPLRGAIDRLAVAGQRDPRRELDDPLQRRDVVAERVRPALRIEPDRRRDRIEDVVGSDEHAVAKQPELPVGVARERHRLPAVDPLARGDRRRVRHVADELRVGAAGAEQLVGDRAGDPVLPEPGCDALGPLRIAPDELALGEVELALANLGARQLRDVCRGAHVVGMEVRDHHPLDVEPAELLGPALTGVRQAEAGVDQRPAVVARQQVRMHVPRPRGQRQRDAADPIDELVHDRY